MSEPRFAEPPSPMPTPAPADVLPTEGRGEWCWLISTWALWLGVMLVLALGILIGFVIGVLA